MAARFEFMTHFREVVNFTVEDNRGQSITGSHRLTACWGEIDYREPAVPEANFTLDKDPLLIRPTMSNQITHRLHNVRIAWTARSEVVTPCDTTHGLRSPVKLAGGDPRSRLACVQRGDKWQHDAIGRQLIDSRSDRPAALLRIDHQIVFDRGPEIPAVAGAECPPQQRRTIQHLAKEWQVGGYDPGTECPRRKQHATAGDGVVRQQHRVAGGHSIGELGLGQYAWERDDRAAACRSSREQTLDIKRPVRLSPDQQLNPSVTAFDSFTCQFHPLVRAQQSQTTHDRFVRVESKLHAC